MHPPKPTRKQKRRYVITSFNREDLSYEEMKEIITENFRFLFGMISLTRARLLFVKNTENTIICRINTEYLDELRTTMLFLRNYKRKNVSSRIVLVSGTLKSLRAKFFKESQVPDN